TGSSFSCVAPAVGRLVLAKWPPFGLSQTQTFGGVYSAVSVMFDLLDFANEVTTRLASPLDSDRDKWEHNENKCSSLRGGAMADGQLTLNLPLPSRPDAVFFALRPDAAAAEALADVARTWRERHSILGDIYGT